MAREQPITGDTPDEADDEVATDALVDGDVPFTPGTARAALAHRNFRIVWAGALSSSIGTWMQNVVLVDPLVCARAPQADRVNRSSSEAVRETCAAATRRPSNR